MYVSDIKSLQIICGSYFSFVYLDR